MTNIITQERNFPQSLRAISIHLPHVLGILWGVKTEEYRSKPTNYRGWALLHASQTKDSDDWLEDYREEAEGLLEDAEFDSQISAQTLEKCRKAIAFTAEDLTPKRGKILGAAQIINCIPNAGEYAYVLGEVVEFANGLPAKGQQSIFWLASTPERIAAFNQAWGMLQAHLK